MAEAGVVAQSIGGGTGGEERNVTVTADLSLAFGDDDGASVARISLQAAARVELGLRVLKGGRLILLPRLCLPAPGLPLGSGSGG